MGSMRAIPSPARPHPDHKTPQRALALARRALREGRTSRPTLVKNPRRQRDQASGESELTKSKRSKNGEASEANESRSKPSQTKAKVSGGSEKTLGRLEEGITGHPCALHFRRSPRRRPASPPRAVRVPLWRFGGNIGGNLGSRRATLTFLAGSVGRGPARCAWGDGAGVRVVARVCNVCDETNRRRGVAPNPSAVGRTPAGRCAPPGLRRLAAQALTCSRARVWSVAPRTGKSAHSSAG
jgi:hypothetical protein